MAVIVQIDTLAARVGGDEYANGTVFLAKGSHHLFLLCIGKAAIEKGNLLIFHSKVFQQTAFQIIHGLNTLGKHHNTLVCFLTLPTKFPELLAEGLIPTVYVHCQHIVKHVHHLLQLLDIDRGFLHSVLYGFSGCGWT